MPITLDELLSEKDGYRMVRPVRLMQNTEFVNHNYSPVYGCNVTTSMFYEETPFRPDLLLQDLIKILHPDIPNLPEPRYYHKVE